MYKIGEIAQKTDVTTRTLRYYEEMGILKPSKISETGYRYYDDDALLIIERIKNLQHVGLSLNEIKDVIGLYFLEGKPLEAKEKTINYLKTHLDQINTKIEMMQRAKTEIEEQIISTQEKLVRLKNKNK